MKENFSSYWTLSDFSDIQVYDLYMTIWWMTWKTADITLVESLWCQDLGSSSTDCSVADFSGNFPSSSLQFS